MHRIGQRARGRIDRMCEISGVALTRAGVQVAHASNESFWLTQKWHDEVIEMARDQLAPNVAVIGGDECVVLEGSGGISGQERLVGRKMDEAMVTNVRKRTLSETRPRRPPSNDCGISRLRRTRKARV